MEVRIVRQEMGTSHQEFFRLLPIALSNKTFTASGRCIVCEFDGKRVEIDLGLENKRRIALLSIPSTVVEIRLKGFDDKEYANFMITFERTYQRGGG